MRIPEATLILAAERFAGLLLGTAVGDALGLPAENLTADQIRRRWQNQWKMRFIFGRGMVSDDTEHTLMVAQALLAGPRDAGEFQRILAWKLRWWFAGLPGGVGLATAKACVKLWMGFPPDKSAVVSAGSGPAMRSAILGAYFASAPAPRREFVLASSRLTHRGWQAETAALAVAECAALALTGHGAADPAQVISILEKLSSETEWQQIAAAIKHSLAAQLPVSDFARRLGLAKAISGYSLHVVPMAVYAWLRHPGDFRAALISVLECGGDTDTTGAIVGALAGATGGKGGIPSEWLDAVWEWPRSCSVMEQIATRLATQPTSRRPPGPVHYFWPAVALRNFLFLTTVLLHGFRRVAPPY